jgi:hypothetical protein
VFGYKDSGNWNSKPGITGLSFSGGVKESFSINFLSPKNNLKVAELDHAGSSNPT